MRVRSNGDDDDDGDGKDSIYTSNVVEFVENLLEMNKFKKERFHIE